MFEHSLAARIPSQTKRCQMAHTLNCAGCKLSREADEQLTRVPYCELCGALLWQGDPKAAMRPHVAKSPPPTSKLRPTPVRRTRAPGLVQTTLRESARTERATTLLLLSLVGLLGVGYTAFAMVLNFNSSLGQPDRSKLPAKIESRVSRIGCKTVPGHVSTRLRAGGILRAGRSWLCGLAGGHRADVRPYPHAHRLDQRFAADADARGDAARHRGPRGEGAGHAARVDPAPGFRPHAAPGDGNG